MAMDKLDNKKLQLLVVGISVKPLWKALLIVARLLALNPI